MSMVSFDAPIEQLWFTMCSCVCDNYPALEQPFRFSATRPGTESNVLFCHPKTKSIFYERMSGRGDSIDLLIPCSANPAYPLLVASLGIFLPDLVKYIRPLARVLGLAVCGKKMCVVQCIEALVYNATRFSTLDREYYSCLLVINRSPTTI
jgi:hypothetical protein